MDRRAISNGTDSVVRNWSFLLAELAGHGINPRIPYNKVHGVNNATHFTHPSYQYRRAVSLTVT